MHGSITGVHYQDLSGKIPKIPDFYYNNNNNNGHIFNAACPAPAVNWQIVQQANGAPPALTPVDLNGNSPLFAAQQASPATAMTGGAGHQNYVVIGDDTTTTTSNNDGGRETPQTPTFSANQSRWTACFPPPSILPLWCITSTNQNSNIAPPQNNDQPAEIALNNNSYYVNHPAAVRMANDATAAYKESASTTPVVVGVHKISLATPVDAASYVVRQVAENAATAQPPTPNDFETRAESRNDINNPFENGINNPNMNSASTLSSADIELESLRYKLQKQLEYYFSRENLTTDAYLKSQMDGDQFVAIKTIANFNKVKKMTSDLDLVISVLRESSVVQVDEKGEKVRAVSKRRTLVLRDIPDETTESEIYELFKDEKYPTVSSVEYCHNNSWYVSFESDEDAQKAYVHLSQEMATLKGRRISARIKNDPIRRIAIVGQQQTSQANGMFSPQNVAQTQLSLSTSSQTVDGSIQNLTLVPSSMSSNAGAPPTVHSPTNNSQTSSSNNGVSGLNHKPPMDPVGASSTTPNVVNQQQQQQNVNATVVPMAAAPASYATLPAAFPPGMILYATQNPRALAAALGTNQQLMAAGLPPNVMAGAPGPWSQASTGLLPYIDISQILTLQNHGAFRPNFPVFVPTTSAAAAAAAVNLAASGQSGYGDRRNKRNNGPNFNGNRAASNVNSLMGPAATFRGPMNSIAVAAAHQLNMLNDQARRLTPSGGAAAAMIPTSLAAAAAAAAAYPGGFVAGRPFGGAPFFATAAAPWLDNGHHHRNFASNLQSSFTGAYANAHNRNNSNNGLPINANRHSSIGNSTTNNDSHANGNNHSRGYNGRSSYQSNNSDYSKDTPNFTTNTKYRRQFSNSNYSKNYASNYNNQTGGTNHNGAAKTSEVPPQEKESQPAENFDLQASSFPPLSETCPSQPHAKISYAEKAKNGVAAAAVAVVASPNKKSSAPVAVAADSSNESAAAVVVNREKSQQNGENAIKSKNELKNDVEQQTGGEKTENFYEKSSRGKEYSGRKQFRNNNRRLNSNANEKFHHQNETKIRSPAAAAVVNQEVLVNNNAQEQTVSV